MALDRLVVGALDLRLVREVRLLPRERDDGGSRALQPGDDRGAEISRCSSDDHTPSLDG